MLFLNDAQHMEASQHFHSIVGSESRVRALSTPADLTCPAQPQVGPPPTTPAQEHHLHPALSRCPSLSSAISVPAWSLPSQLWTCTVALPPALALALSAAAALDETSWMVPRPGSPSCLVWVLLMEPISTTPTLPPSSDSWARLVPWSPLAHGVSLPVEQPCSCCSPTASNKYCPDAAHSLPLKPAASVHRKGF